MAQYSYEEIHEAFLKYNEARDEASRSGDWGIWAARFTEDAHYIEHAYGEMDGRAAIEEWITKVMAPFPNMTFPQDWFVIDVPNGAVVFQCQNEMPPPFDENGQPFRFPNWTRIVYGGNGLWKEEEDIYNPKRDAPDVFRKWRAAGGAFRTGEQVEMVHR